MIIQCQKCQTKFRLDDSKVTGKGVKVRCTKCKHVFVVQKDEPEAAPSEPERVVADFSFPAADGDESAAPHEVQNPFDTSSFDASALSFESESFGADELHVPDSGNEPAAAVETIATAGEFDFSSFAFGESASEQSDSVPGSPMPLMDDAAGITAEPAPAAPQEETPQDFDFSADMFAAVVESVPEVSSGAASSVSDDDGGAVAMSGQDSNGKSGSLFSLDTPPDAPLHRGGIDTGGELAPPVTVQQEKPDDRKQSQDTMLDTLIKAQDKAVADESAQSFPKTDSDDQQELPPLLIASRRKRSPIFAALIVVIVLLVISVLGYLGYSSFFPPKDAAAPETGKIGVRAVNAAFIRNNIAGELLVVSGEALNEYPKARAALQVKVSVFDAAEQSVATKSAYGGNPLTREQLENLPLDKIEAAMANQFGDSLANMEVAPGKAIPFVVVLANLPKGAKDFTVQSAGSTVATAKQQ